MPTELNSAKTYFLVSAIFNILILLGWTGTTIFGGLMTCGIGCLFGVFPVINIIAAIMDFISYNKLNSGSRYDTFSTIRFAAIFDIITILTGNIVSCIFGII